MTGQGRAMQKEIVGRIIEKAAPEPGAAPGVPGVPDAADLAKIRPYMLTDPDPSKLYVRRLILANDAPDREHERFPKRILERFAATIPGKSLLVSHEKKSLPLGLFFDGVCRKAQGDEEGAWVVEAAFYLVANPANLDLRQQIDAGVIRYCSVGAGYDTRICDVCGSDYYDCAHSRGQVLADGRQVTLSYGGDLNAYDVREGSLVYLGAQRGARIHKEFEGDSMDLEKIGAQLEAMNKAFAARFEALEKKDEPKTKDGDRATEKATGLAGDGEAYRKDLAADIKRLAKIMEQEDQADLLLTAMPDAPATALKTIRDGYQQKVDEKYPPAPLAHLNKIKDDEEPKGQNPAARFRLG